MNAASVQNGTFITADIDGEQPEDLLNCSNIVRNVCRLLSCWGQTYIRNKYVNTIAPTSPDFVCREKSFLSFLLTWIHFILTMD